MSASAIIYLHRLDSLEAVRSLIAGCAGAQVWLVAPFDMPAVAKLVNLKLMRRAAEAAQVDLRLVSLRREVRVLAREAGIAAYWALPLGLAGVRRRRSTGAPSQRKVEAPAQAARRYRRKPRVRGVPAGLLTLISVVLVLGLAGASVGLFMPAAQVSLQPVTTAVERRFQVVADTRYHKADSERMIIPARQVEVVIDGRGDTPATGRLDIMDARAEGEVVFSNKTNEVVQIPQGTVVRSGVGTPVRFTTTNDVELPAQQNSTVRVSVVALDAGPIGNVGALTINVIEGSLASLADVLNEQPTQGGTVKRIATVAYGDFDLLRSDLSAKLQQEAFDQLIAGLSEGEFIPPSTVEVQILSQASDQIVDQQADMLAMTMKLLVRGLVVDGQALQQVASDYLAQEAASDVMVIPASLKAAPSGEMRMEENTLAFGVLASGQLGPRIDEQRVKALVRGRDPAQAIDLLNTEFELQSPAQVIIEPDWWPYLPYLAQRIRVNIIADQP